jgi:hypothetical protein
MLIPFLLQLAFAAPAPNAAGVPLSLPATRYEFVMEGSMSNGTGGFKSTMRMTYAGDKYRMDVLERTGLPTPGLTGAGTFTIVADKHIYMVDTARKEFSELDLAKMQGQMAALMKSVPGMSLKFSQLKSDAEDLGEGEAVLGHPTHHWRVTQTISMNAVVQSDTMSMSTETVSDRFFATDIQLPQPPMLNTDSASFFQFGDLVPAADMARMRATIAKLPRSVELKSASKVTTYFGPMDFSVNTTSRVTKIEKVEVDPSIFELPHGYKKVEMPVAAAPPSGM